MMYHRPVNIWSLSNILILLLFIVFYKHGNILIFIKISFYFQEFFEYFQICWFLCFCAFGFLYALYMQLFIKRVAAAVKLVPQYIF